MDSQIRYEPHHDQRVFTHGLDSPQPHPPTRNKRKLAGRGQGRGGTALRRRLAPRGGSWARRGWRLGAAGPADRALEKWIVLTGSSSVS